MAVYWPVCCSFLYLHMSFGVQLYSCIVVLLNICADARVGQSMYTHCVNAC